jgi:hypothetical protein
VTFTSILANFKLSTLVPHLNRHHERKKHRDFADSSEPLFSMYWDMAEEEDNKVLQSWEKDAKPIIFFVCSKFDFNIASLHIFTYHRPVCSLPQWPHYLQ